MARPRKGVTFWDRVYAHVKRNHAWGCLEFTGHKDECGYGRINKDGRLVRIHRAVWERDRGEIPVGMVVMHSCDNPCCIDPEHLFLGTQSDNVADMNRKGRHHKVRGTGFKSAKLTEGVIPSIRKRLNSGETCASIARDHRVSEELIRNIKNGRNWTHA